ncbi:hypothetical protein [Taibaiella chishuiensis]|uniref:Uncharacterized protein n=1 Tax=Taibaiella chishuiensis TaxID=1434707 RepID=A0A2P8CZB7_9BACT|nr:hypothetical protein [Taibaiella chishuiensis]PSK90311.1 hypothetical protein B0I18_10839 [Taibaiella chishuiensis]
MILLLLWIFFIAITAMYTPSILRILSNNRSKRKQAALYSEAVLNAGADQDPLAAELDFALATISTDKDIAAIRELLARNAETISPFFVIETVSVCSGNSFLIAGNFTGTRQTARQRTIGVTIWETSMERLYAGNMVVQQNEDRSVTLRSVFPEDKEHDLYIRDFISSFKRLIS